MRLSEAITIYLAAGASFGVHDFRREQNHTRSNHALLKAILAAILWPLVVARFFGSRRPEKGRPADENERAREQFVEETAQARRKFLASLYRAVELAQSSPTGKSQKAERAARALREIAERYVELTMAAVETDHDSPPSTRETELCRIAGRRGDDLLLAGRLIHRRNHARLISHQARARTELLHALAEIREILSDAAKPTNVASARHLSVETLRLYGQAFNLLSLLEDESAAISLARLVEAECRRLRGLEALNKKKSNNTQEESCTIPETPLPLTGTAETRALN